MIKYNFLHLPPQVYSILMFLPICYSDAIIPNIFTFLDNITSKCTLFWLSKLILKFFLTVATFICIWASIGRNPERMYGTGSAVFIGYDSTFLKSLLKNSSKRSRNFFTGSSISTPYINIGTTYIFSTCIQVAGSTPLLPWNPTGIRL